MEITEIIFVIFIVFVMFIFSNTICKYDYMINPTKLSIIHHEQCLHCQNLLDLIKSKKIPKFFEIKIIDIRDVLLSKEIQSNVDFNGKLMLPMIFINDKYIHTNNLLINYLKKLPDK